MTGPKLDMILEKTSAGSYQLWACRGEGKGCKRNTFRDKQFKKHCDDCFLCDPKDTIGDVMEKMAKGDA